MQPPTFKTKAMQRAEHLLGQPLEIWLASRYEAGATQAEIASELKIDTGTVSRWMSQLGIEAQYGPKKRAVA
jgi:DNA-binding transcriptional regulator LsrR (DeoR family)